MLTNRVRQWEGRYPGHSHRRERAQINDDELFRIACCVLRNMHATRNLLKFTMRTGLLPKPRHKPNHRQDSQMFNAWCELNL